MGTYKVDFKKLKETVGIDTVAQKLGYEFNPRAGKGSWAEYDLKNGGKVVDTIIIHNPRVPARQTYFRRSGGLERAGGDVISFIRENINAFNVSGSEWQKIGQVMCDCANLPRPDYENAYGKSVASGTREFDRDRYMVKPIDGYHMRKLFAQRGLTEDTMKLFAPSLVMIKDLAPNSFAGYNLGFPYVNLAENKVEGYEMRGYGGFKSMAAGTNAGSTCWVANFAGNNPVKTVYCFESGYDAMAFVQHNKATLNLSETAVVSIGGQIGLLQAKNLIRHFEGAKFVDCFDYDVAGRSYGIKLAAIKAGAEIRVGHDVNGVNVEYGDKRQYLPLDEANAEGLRKHFGIESGVGVKTTPAGFKDWNDLILDKRIEPKQTPSKLERNENLASRRGRGI